VSGGGERDRTDDPLLAKQVLSQLSYTPGTPEQLFQQIFCLVQRFFQFTCHRSAVVGLVGLEPTTPALSRRCSNQLSYRPAIVLQALLLPHSCSSLPGLKAFLQQPISVDPEQNRPAVFFSRKEVIQPHLPIRLPCYDFTPVMNPTVVTVLLAVRLATSGKTHSHGVTGGVYKTRERIHRDMLIRDY
jgi:hypothetical protein